MKWQTDDCKCGDIVRVKDGAVCHFGIFVSEDEVIAFGRVPSYYLTKGRGEKIVVLATSAKDFANGNFAERGVPERNEKKQLRSQNEIVAAARSRLGEEGYNVIHNNCEHFVNECAFGVRRSAQEEEMRRRWSERPKFDVYVCFDGSVPQAEHVPEERLRLLKEISSEKLLREKNLTWNLLSYAIGNSFCYNTKELKFKIQKNGKWVCDKVHFSLSHSDGVAVVAVSNAPCGVDVENIEKFFQKCSDNTFVTAFSQKIGCDSVDATCLLKSWTGKESVYKAQGKGHFVPRDVLTDNKVRHVRMGDYLIAVFGENYCAASYYLVENGRSKLMFKGDYEWI